MYFSSQHKYDLLEQVDRLPYRGGNTNTTDGLMVAKDLMFSAQGGYRAQTKQAAWWLQKTWCSAHRVVIVHKHNRWPDGCKRPDVQRTGWWSCTNTTGGLMVAKDLMFSAQDGDRAQTQQVAWWLQKTWCSAHRVVIVHKHNRWPDGCKRPDVQRTGWWSWLCTKCFDSAIRWWGNALGGEIGAISDTTERPT